jgi:hypothetical protein
MSLHIIPRLLVRCLPNFIPFYVLTVMVTVLDPRISYEGVCADYENDSELSEYLETAKAALHQHYKDNYIHLANSSSPTSSPHR